jgi:hypothetical protein
MFIFAWKTHGKASYFFNPETPPCVAMWAMWAMVIFRADGKNKWNGIG